MLRRSTYATQVYVYINEKEALQLRLTGVGNWPLN